MRARELFESRYAELYHGTSIANLIRMLQQNRMCSGAEEYGAASASISFTREPKVAMKFANSKSASVLECWMNDQSANTDLSSDPTDEEMAEKLPLAWAEHYFHSSWRQNGGGAIVVFDQEKLRQRYRLIPYCDQGGRGANGEKWEMEEVVRRDIKPVLPYIVSIQIFGPFGAIIDAIIKGDPKAMLTPHPEYEHVRQIVRSLGR